MAYRDYWGTGGGGRGRLGSTMGSSFMTPAVKWLLISNVAIFILYFFAIRLGGERPFVWLSLIPRWVLSLSIWQLVTYLFIHSPYDFLHILFNMLFLWFFGRALESTWGTQRFLRFYFLCGIGAGLCVVLLALMVGNVDTRTIGASGAIYGLLLAFGMLFPNEEILFLGQFPMKARWFVLIMGAMAFLLTFGSTSTGGGGGVSHVAHLGGMIFGYLYLKSQAMQRFATGADPAAWIARTYRDWRHERAKKKFQVYLRKRQDRDRTIH
jgi:membrane associated rhomboid family serine protease